jgi:6,7-dimethyl-8-ribityllumazine synthase
MSTLRPDTPEPDGTGLRVAVVASRFNSEVVERLLTGTLAALTRWGVAEEDLLVLRVAGAWEVPQALEAVARRGGFDALVALGAVIRGETPHFDIIAAECSRGAADVALRHTVAVGFGVLACNTLEQALERSGGAAGHKGVEAAAAALDLASTFRRLRI